MHCFVLFVLDLIAAVQSHFERVELFVELRRHLADLLVILTRVLALLEPELAVDREQAALQHSAAK